jgi:hypothetical protein
MKLDAINFTHTKKDFEEFHKNNPDVYEMFVMFSKQAAVNNKNYSARGVFHRIRWETSVNSNDRQFKLNDIWTAYYARKFMEDYPEYQGFFRLRKENDPRFK